MSNKKVIRLTEKDLHKIVKESVNKILNEQKGKMEVDIDISKIPIEHLRAAYRDLRLVPTPSTMFGHPLYDVEVIKEAVGDIYEPDEVCEMICKKYHFATDLMSKIENYHGIFVYSIIANIGVNTNLIEQDMEKLGYFLSCARPQSYADMEFMIMQFEPTSQLQEDVTDEIKAACEVLFHATPTYNVESIMENGLIPSHRNYKFKYPPRTYLMDGREDEKIIKSFASVLCSANKDPRNDGEYTILSVNIQNLDETIRFFYDPNSAIGIYTEQTIPRENLKIETNLSFEKGWANRIKFPPTS